VSRPARRFLFLQGPHGPWFHRLARHLRTAGAEVWRVGFNLGDRMFWPGAGYIGFKESQDHWPDRCAALFDQHHITDLVVYGDTRPVHAKAVQLAKARGITVHVFEEGYLRPYWVTYERGGSNGHSRLMDLSVAEMRAALLQVDPDLPTPPATWGDMREHMFWGALYHGCVAAGGASTATSGHTGPCRSGRNSGFTSCASCSCRFTRWSGCWLPSASGAAAFPIIWPSCNWNMTQASATIRPSPA